MEFKKYFLVGGAGFIGSHFTDALLKRDDVEKVTIYDNFSSGREWHFKSHLSDPRFNVIRGDVHETVRLNLLMSGHDTVMHFASNPDIAKAATDPNVDFVQGIYLTHYVLEAIRLNQVKRVIYISGSGVYGDLGAVETPENYSPLLPVSTYGASKLAGEVFISSYCHMFGLTACIFRFANVVGPRQTHGVGYDFAKRLLQDPSKIRILGDGSQSKSYIYVEDVVSAVMTAHEKQTTAYEIYNVGTKDYITVKEIADIAVECAGIKEKVRYEFTGGDRGWKGDIPVMRLNTDKIRSLGWANRRDSKEAVRDSIQAILKDLKAGLIQ